MLVNAMELIKLAQCKKDLTFQFTHFESTAKYASLLPVAIQNQLICGFSQSENGQVINYTFEEIKTITEFAHIVRTVYHDLTFLEVVRFYKKCEAWIHEYLKQESQDSLELLNQILNPFEFYAAFGFRYSENLQLSIQKILSLPESFLAWCHQKKWGPQDFAPLRSVENTETLKPFLNHMCQSPFSKTESTAIFELYIELTLMEHPQLSSLLDLPFTQWMQQLKKWRYPVQHKVIAKEDSELKKLPWPMDSQAKWVQRGDRSGIELKLFFSHPQEFARALQRLELISETFQKDEGAQKLWSLSGSTTSPGSERFI